MILCLSNTKMHCSIGLVTECISSLKGPNIYREVTMGKKDLEGRLQALGTGSGGLVQATSLTYGCVGVTLRGNPEDINPLPARGQLHSAQPWGTGSLAIPGLSVSWPLLGMDRS
jgi:hypothetical protein